MREVRTALLEADVSLPVARSFVQSVSDKAKGQAVTKSVTAYTRMCSQIAGGFLSSCSSTERVAPSRTTATARRHTMIAPASPAGGHEGHPR